MRCNCSKFFLISILTFMVGIGTVGVWQSFFSVPILVAPPKMTDISESIKPIEKVKRHNPCEGYENLNIHSKAKHTVTAREVLNQKAVCVAEAVYPHSALAVKASGEVKVGLLLDESGKVVFAKAVSGHPLLRPAAVTVAFQSKFSPTLLGGESVKVKGVFIVKFVLPN